MASKDYRSLMGTKIANLNWPPEGSKMAWAGPLDKKQAILRRCGNNASAFAQELVSMAS